MDPENTVWPQHYYPLWCPGKESCTVWSYRHQCCLCCCCVTVTCGKKRGKDLLSYWSSENYLFLELCKTWWDSLLLNTLWGVRTVCVDTRTYIHTHVPACMHMHTHTCMVTAPHTHTRTRMHARTLAQIHYTHTHIYIYIYRYIYTHT